MSIEGLWSVIFSGRVGPASAGVVIFERGRIFGGDTHMYYIGDYEIKNGILSGSIRVRVHSNVLGIVSVTGSDDFTATLTAATVAKQMQLTLDVQPSGAGKIQAALSKITDLP
ncbi:MAG TPA: GrlR family regulatory protein [Gammaproteobacteria bacterium]|nr:GrlR family regulatory protein [Gammaproteobacteria bacterium]